MTSITNCQCHETLNRLWEFQRIIGIIGIILSRTSYDRSFYDRSFVLSFVLRSYDRSCLQIRSLVFTIARAYKLQSLVLTIARAYDRSCLRSIERTIARDRAYDRSCLRSLWSLVLTIALIARACDRSCLRSLVLTVARAYDRSYDRPFFRYHGIVRFDTTLVFVNTFNDVYSVVVLTVCTMKCILSVSLNTPHL